MKKLNDYIDFKQLLLGIIVFLIFYCSSLFQLIPIKLLNLKPSNINNVILSCFSSFVLLIILFIIYRKQLIKEFRIFKSNILTNLDIGFKYWLLGLFGMFLSNCIIIFIVGLNQAQNEQAVQKMISTLPWLMLITAGVIAPITEEIVFRKSFKNSFKNKYLFIILSGVVFGFLHVISSYNSPIELLYIIPYSSLGIAFATMYYKTNTIYTSISMHMLHNIILTLISIISL